MSQQGTLFKAAVRSAVVLASLAGISCGKPAAPPAPPPAQVQVAGVIVRDVPITREWVGETLGQSDIEIRARVAGFLEEIHFEEGRRVKKDQRLYSIDQSELLQEVTAAQADLAAARTVLANASNNVRRYRPLAEINAISERDLDNAVAREEASASEVEAAEARLRLAEIQLSYTEVRAPMDGLIGLTQAKVGDFVGRFPNPVVLNTVSRIDPIHIRFAVTEQEYLDFARRFDPVKTLETREEEGPQLELILADGTVHPHRGQAETVDREVNAMTGTLTVEASFPNPKRILRPGLYGKVRTEIEVRKNALLVPQRAVQEIQGQFRIWTVGSDDTVASVNVTPGPRVEDLWVIEAGLEPSARIVVEGLQRLRAGASVAATPYKPSAAAPAGPGAGKD